VTALVVVGLLVAWVFVVGFVCVFMGANKSAVRSHEAAYERRLRALRDEAGMR
jgi:hypothetical protein